MIAQVFDISSVQEKFPDARQETNGSITFECPVCRDEEHPNKRITLFANGATSCARFAGAGADANRKHCAPIREKLGLGPNNPKPAIKSILFKDDRQITLEIERVSKQAQFVTARNCTSVLHSAEIRLSKPDERANFVVGIPDRDESESNEISKELIQLYDRYRKAQEANDDGSEQDGRESAATRLVKLAEEAQLIHNPDREGFALMIADGHKETWALRSKGFKRWLVRRFFEEYEKAPGSQAVQDALGVIEGKAVYDGPERNIFIRIGERDGKIYLDLADEHWRVVEIDQEGWRVVAIPPVEFRRAKGMLPLPVPEKGGSIEELRPFLNLGKGDLWVLMLGSLVMKFRPRGPYNVDVFTGGQGCGKTTRARVIRSLVDPSSADTRSAPRELRDLQIAASNEWLPVFDNLSRIPEWLSDGFCCLSTGGGMRTRELYSDNEESIFSTMRPVILTSITEVVERPDLLDRSIIFNLPEIERNQRKPEKQFWRDFDRARPRILGALLDAVSCALRNEDEVVLEESSRLADFERWAIAAETALGLKPGSFLAAYRKNQSSANDLALEASPITESIINLAQSTGEWIGTARELFDLLSENVSEDDARKRKEQGWPKAPNVLSSTLRRLAPNLKIKGVNLEFNIRNDKKGSRKIRISYNGGDAAPEPGVGNPADRDYECGISPVTVRPSEATDSKDFMSGTSDGQSSPSDDLTVIDNVIATYTEVPLSQSLTGVSGDLTQPDDVFPANSDSPLGLIALDTETQPFDPGRGITPRTTRMIGLALSYDGEKADYETDPASWPLIMPEPEQTVVLHNAKFDLGVLAREGLPLPQKWEDTMIAAHLIEETGDHGLKPLAKQILNIEETISFDEVERLRLLDPEIFNEYAKNDARYTFRLWPVFQNELNSQGLTQVYELEKKIVPAVLAMEEAGIRIDLDRMAEMRAAVQEEADRIEAEIYDYAGSRFDLHSPAKVAAILYDKLGVPSQKKTNGGQRSVDREALEEVRGYHPAVDAILRYREIDKLAATFLSVLPKFADENGRIHPEFRPLGASSGRFSCSNPNVQQIPSRSELGRKLRRMFIAEKGNVLVVADWSQMELRILAQYSKDPLLLEAYTAGHDTDLHTLTAARMFSKAESKVTKAERSIAKMINFGIAYGITPIGLFNRLKPQGVDVTLVDCERFIGDYFKTYAGVKKFLRQVESRLLEKGYVRNWFGRRRRLSGLTAREIRQAQNFIIQSTAADLAKTAMAQLHSVLPPDSRLIAMIHDEFIVECPDSRAEEVRNLMVDVMQTTPENFKVPMIVEAKIASNWGDAK